MEENENSVKPLLNNTAYDRLKFVAQILLPGIGALYFALASIWGLPKAEEVVGTITAVDVFLGLFLARASSRYSDSDEWYDGYVPADSLPQELVDKGYVTMKVSRPEEH